MARVRDRIIRSVRLYADRAVSCSVASRGFTSGAGLHFAWALALLLAGATAAEGQDSAPERSRLIAHFQLDGVPHPVTVTIAAERFRRTFREVTHLDETVPSDATYTIEAAIAVEGDHAGVTFKDLIPSLRLPPRETTEMVVHLVSGDRIGSFEPVVLLEEAGADATVESRIERDAERPERFTLRSEVDATAGTWVILDTVLEPLDSRQGFVCEAPCQHVMPVDCSVHCYTCSTTASLQGNVWKENFNMCSLTSDGGGSPVASTFEPIPQTLGGMVLNAAVRDDAIVAPLVTQLTDLRSASTVRLVPPFATRSFPDFVVPTGFYTYFATFPVPGGADRSRTFSLPVEITGSEILSVFMTLPAPHDLRPFAASVLGDSRLGLAVTGVSATLHRGSTLRVDVDMGPLADGVGWILVPLPPNRSVTGIRRLPLGKTEGGEPLTEHRDYTVRALDNRNALVFRTTERSARYVIQLER